MFSANQYLQMKGGYLETDPRAKVFVVKAGAGHVEKKLPTGEKNINQLAFESMLASEDPIVTAMPWVHIATGPTKAEMFGLVMGMQGEDMKQKIVNFMLSLGKEEAPIVVSYAKAVSEEVEFTAVDVPEGKARTMVEVIWPGGAFVKQDDRTLYYLTPPLGIATLVAECVAAPYLSEEELARKFHKAGAPVVVEGPAASAKNALASWSATMETETSRLFKRFLFDDKNKDPSIIAETDEACQGISRRAQSQLSSMLPPMEGQVNAEAYIEQYARRLSDGLAMLVTPVRALKIAGKYQGLYRYDCGTGTLSRK